MATLVPETRYAKTGGVHIAYQVVGEGEPLVFLSEWVTQLEVAWEWPAERGSMLGRAASVAKLVLFDKRGMGLSDPVPLDETVSLEAWVDDLRTVLDAAGIDRATLLGHGQGATMALLFAATFPQRVSSLVIVNGYARLARAADYPCGIPEAAQKRTIEFREKTWGTPAALAFLAPSVAGDERVRAWWSRMERLACSPGAAMHLQAVTFEHDVREVLPAISVPTLVLHVRDNQWIRVGHGRYLAERIPGARYVEFAGSDHWFWVGESAGEIDAAIQEFVTGAPVARPVAELDRVLATVLFSDIVASTERAAAVGDQAWRGLLDAYHAIARREVERHRGRVVEFVGDGMLATFDGPARAIRCAEAIRDSARTLSLEIRSGLHTGEVELAGTAIRGIAVHIGSRVSAEAGAGEVVVSSTVKDLVAGSGIRFIDRGERVLKGIPGQWRLYAAQ